MSRPAELQFYTSMASVVVQIPASLLLVDLVDIGETTTASQLSLYILNGVFFHFQSITAYVLMDYISPVTHRYFLSFGYDSVYTTFVSVVPESNVQDMTVFGCL